MKKFMLVAMLLGMVVSVAGCDLYGNVKKVTIKYTTADYVNQKIVKHAVTNLGTDISSNSFVTIDDSGSHFVLTTSASGYPISSNSAGIWIINIAGNVVDPSEYVLDNSFASNATCLGIVRVSGTGNYDPLSDSVSGDGQFIIMNTASMDIVGKGKYDTGSPVYNGVAKVTITPGNAALMTFVGGVPTSIVPVEAVITITGMTFTN